MLACGTTHQMCRNLRRISKRLVIHGRQRADNRLRLGRRDEHLCMLRAEVLRYGARVGRFVEPGLLETNREGLYRTAGLLLHQRHDGRRIHPA